MEEPLKTDNPNNQDAFDSIRNLAPEVAIEWLNVYIEIHPGSDEALTLRGMKHWSLNHRREAINDYLAAIKINPESKAKTALNFVNSVLDYYNKDLLNP